MRTGNRKNNPEVSDFYRGVVSRGVDGSDFNTLQGCFFFELFKKISFDDMVLFRGLNRFLTPTKFVTPARVDKYFIYLIFSSNFNAKSMI